MPTTSLGLRYPSSTDNVNPPEDFQFLASDVNDVVSPLVNVPLAQLRQSVSQSLANATWTTITFDAEDLDTAGGHSTSSNTGRYTAQRTGHYQLSGAVSFGPNATGARWCKWMKNGSELASSGANMAPAPGGQTLLTARTIVVRLVVGDYVELQAYQTSGGSISTYPDVPYAAPSMSVRWISA
ncbi:hypothetical protein V6U77_22870 [Micromonospora sp. CPCC 205546]